MLTQAGYDMIGIDQSEEMLCVVRDKAEQLGLSGRLLLLRQDLRKLDLYGTIRGLSLIHILAERFTRFLKAIDAAGDGAEMNRCYLEQRSTHPDLMGPEVLDVLRELSEVATLAVVTNGFQKVQIRRLAESGVLNFMAVSYTHLGR